MIIEKDYFDAEEVDIANAMNDKSRAPIRKIRIMQRQFLLEIRKIFCRVK